MNQQIFAILFLGICFIALAVAAVYLAGQYKITAQKCQEAVNRTRDCPCLFPQAHQLWG